MSRILMERAMHCLLRQSGAAQVTQKKASLSAGLKGVRNEERFYCGVELSFFIEPFSPFSIFTELTWIWLVLESALPFSST
jgi:hypothetical protein